MIAFLITTLLTTTLPPVDDGGGEDPRLASREAEWRELNQRLRQLGADEDPSDLQFEMAFFLEDWSDEIRGTPADDPGGEGPDRPSTRLTNMARDLYRRILTRHPGRTVAADNLALLLWNRGDVDGATTVLQDVLKASETGDRYAAERRATLGDLRMEQRDYEGAWREYAQALEVRTGDDLGLRLVDSCRAMPSKQRQPFLPGLAKRAEQLRAAGDLASASAAYALLLEEFGPDRERDPELVSGTLRDWIEVEAGLRSFNRQRLTRWRILRERELTAYLEMERMLAEPDTAREAGWWGRDARNRHVMTVALWCQGRDHARRGQPEAAVHFLQVAFDSVMDYGEYRHSLPQREYPGTDIALSMAELYHGYESLRGDFGKAQEQLSNLEDQLWRGKNQEYARQNKPAMQRYHTVLGLIYAEQDRFGGGWRDAPYHLRRAINLADELAEQNQEPHPYPLPNLSLTLADGLASVGDKECEAYYERAAFGFLEERDLIQSRKALQGAREFGDQVGADYQWLPHLEQVQNRAEWYQRAPTDELIEHAKTPDAGHAQLWNVDPKAAAEAGVPAEFLHRQEITALTGAAERLSAEDLDDKTQAALDTYLRETDRALKEQLEPGNLRLHQVQDLEGRLKKLENSKELRASKDRIRRDG